MHNALLKKVSVLLSLPVLAMTASLGSTPIELCQGIIEDNNWRIPVNSLKLASGGVTESQYHKVLDEFEAHFKPVISSMGGRLNVKRLWTNSMVNATAQRQGTTYVVNMFGGLARHSAINPDSLMLIACHEMGHHIGGAPKYRNAYGMNWASVEGQSDYYATLRCLGELWSAEENSEWMRTATVDPFLKESCELQWNTQEEEQLCMRSSMAGKSVAMMFKSLRGESRVPQFSAPSSSLVSSTVESHPQTQCRLDTYFQGALCVHNPNVKLSSTNAKTGTCNGNYDRARHGSRPRCWFKPS